MKNICIWGTSLTKVADEAQVISFIKIINDRYPGSGITLFSKFGSLLLELFKEDGFKLNVVRTLNIPGVIFRLYKSDIFIFIGGPFYEQFRQALVCWGLLSICKLFHKPVISYAATAFHFRTWWGKRIYKNIFNRMDAITVREPVGRETIKELNIKKEVEIFADPRFLLTPLCKSDVEKILQKEKINFSRPYICITTRFMHDKIPAWVKKSHNYTSQKNYESNNSISEVVSYLSERFQVILIPMHPRYEEDEKMAEILKRRMKNPEKLILLSGRYRAKEIISIIKYAEMILASRLGSAVFATVVSTPIIAVSYEPRMKEFMNRCNLQDYVFDWRELSFEKIKRAVDKVLSEKEITIKILEENAVSFKEKALLNSELIADFI